MLSSQNRRLSEQHDTADTDRSPPRLGSLQWASRGGGRTRENLYPPSGDPAADDARPGKNAPTTAGKSKASGLPTPETHVQKPTPATGRTGSEKVGSGRTYEVREPTQQHTAQRADK